MAVKFTNNAATTLAAGINSSVTSIAVTDGSVFPTITGSDHFYVTFDDTTNREIVKVTARSGNTLTVIRGQDDTTAQAFNSGDKAELRVVAALLEDVKTEVTSTLSVDTFTGDDTTTAFTLSQAPSSEDNLIVFIEGAYQNPSDFVLSGTTLTFDEAPLVDRNIIVYHVKGAVSGNNLNNDQFTCNGSTTAFTLSLSPIHENNTQVFLDGVYQQKTDYAVSGTTLTMDTAPANGAILEVMTFTQTEVNTLPASFVSGLTQVTAVGADHFMIFDATDSALKKSLVSDVLESATSISTSADATAITIDSSENVTFTAAVTTGTNLSIGGNNNELRFYEGANYVGFEAPALSADKIWVLPAADGSSGQVLTTNGSGTLSFSTVSGTTINNNADNRIITGSGTANTLEGEANLTFDGTNVVIGSSNALGLLTIKAPSSDDQDLITISEDGTNQAFSINSNFAGSGSTNNNITLDSYWTNDIISFRGDGNIGIGTASPVAPLTINDKATFSFNSSDFALGHQLYYDGVDDRWERLTGNAGSAIYQTAGNVLFYRTAAGGSTGDAVTPTESMRIASDGSVGIGTSSPTSGRSLHIYSQNQDALKVQTNTGINQIELANSTNSPTYITQDSYSLILKADENGWGGAASSMQFKVKAAEAMRIDSSQSIYINTTSGYGTPGYSNMWIKHSSGRQRGIAFKATSTSSTDTPCQFFNGGAGVAGQITYTYSATTYSTSSDYRLKENVVYDWDATTRLKQLKPCRFNWIADETNTAIDGFIAHEAAEVVPNSVVGEKDATKDAFLDDDGNEIAGSTIDAQTMDHAKLVPLLVKTIQELEARITTLESS